MHHRPIPLLLLITGLSLVPLPGGARQCTPEQIFHLFDRGFSRDEIRALCELESAAAEAPEAGAVTLASLAGTWQGVNDQGESVRLVIGADGTLTRELTTLYGRTHRATGTVSVMPLGPGRAVMHVKPQADGPRGGGVYAGGVISIPITLPDPDTLATALGELKRRD
ncbi:MAG: hypothetical protein M3Z21_17020 [Pseudomonadota bacterium]|nr:hypothetical protein [Pseudomonadota bacterium]